MRRWKEPKSLVCVGMWDAERCLRPSPLRSATKSIFIFFIISVPRYLCRRDIAIARNTIKMTVIRGPSSWRAISNTIIIINSMPLPSPSSSSSSFVCISPFFNLTFISLLFSFLILCTLCRTIACVFRVTVMRYGRTDGTTAIRQRSQQPCRWTVSQWFVWVCACGWLFIFTSYI